MGHTTPNLYHSFLFYSFGEAPARQKKKKILSLDSISHAKGCTSIIGKENTDTSAIEKNGVRTGNSTGCPYEAAQPTVSRHSNTSQGARGGLAVLEDRIRI